MAIKKKRKEKNWNTSLPGWAKLNKDALLWGTIMGGGGLLRDSRGIWISRAIGFKTNIQRELKALKYRWSMSVWQIDVDIWTTTCLAKKFEKELDSLRVVELIKSSMIIDDFLRPIVDKCRYLIGKLQQCRVHQI